MSGPQALRVALVGPLPPPSGGMSNQTRQLAELLRGEGVQVEMVRVNAPYRPAMIGRLPMVRAAFRLAPYLGALWRAIGQADVVHVMANSGWSWHLFAAPAVWVAWLRRVPVLVNYRGGGADSFFRSSFAWVRPTLKRADTVVVPSEFLHEVFSHWGIKAEIVPNIVDLGRFAPAPGIAKERRDPHLLVARNLEPIYDIGTALHAFSLVRQHIPGARLTVAGSGPEAGSLSRLAFELGIEEAVTFAGRVENTAMAELYRSADVSVNPSRVDNMPISILESWASGVPVVSTDVGGVPYLTRAGVDALLVPPGQPQAMADAIVAVLSDHRQAAQLTEAGLARAARYAWPVLRERLLGLYRGLAERSARGLVEGQ